jgi:hypothetical protein
MSNNKQSSVEFILNNIHLKDSLKWQDIIEQAKAMHKEEIEKVSEDWWNEGASYMYDGQRKYNSFEQYYNETYGGNK